MTNPKMSFQIFGKLCKRQFHTTNIKMVSIQLQKQNLLQTKLFINGSWKDGVTGKSFAILDPATNEEITKVSKASEADYEEAIQSAFTSFQSFKKTSARDRSKLLSDLYQSLIKNKEDLGKILCYENGKPLKESIGEIEYAASFFSMVFRRSTKNLWRCDSIIKCFKENYYNSSTNWGCRYHDTMEFPSSNDYKKIRVCNCSWLYCSY